MMSFRAWLTCALTGWVVAIVLYWLLAIALTGGAPR